VNDISNTSPTALLLNVGHAMDHLFLLIFATAVSAIAVSVSLLKPATPTAPTTYRRPVMHFEFFDFATRPAPARS